MTLLFIYAPTPVLKKFNLKRTIFIVPFCASLTKFRTESDTARKTLCTSWEQQNNATLLNTKSDTDAGKEGVRKTAVLSVICLINEIRNVFVERFHRQASLCQAASNPGMSDLAPKWVRLAPNGTNLVLFQIKFQYNLARWAPFGANVTHFAGKSDIPVPTNVGIPCDPVRVLSSQFKIRQKWLFWKVSENETGYLAVFEYLVQLVFVSISVLFAYLCL